MRFLIIFLLMVSTAWAKPPVIFDPGKPEFIHFQGRKFPAISIPLTSEFTYKKPDITVDKNLDAEEREVVEFSLKDNGRKLIFKELKSVKNDYQNDFDRGTVEFNSAKGINMLGREVLEASNYSFNKVVIPDGTTVEGVNFSQRVPHTTAISGNNLTFKNCNLINVQTHPSWTIIDSNTAQIKRVKKSEAVLEDGSKEITISHQVETNGQFIEVTEDVETTTDEDSYNLLMLRLNE